MAVIGKFYQEKEVRRRPSRSPKVSSRTISIFQKSDCESRNTCAPSAFLYCSHHRSELIPFIKFDHIKAEEV